MGLHFQITLHFVLVNAVMRAWPGGLGDPG